MAQTIPWRLSPDSRPRGRAARRRSPAPSAAAPPRRALPARALRAPDPPAATARRSPGRRIATPARLAWLAALLSLVAGCSAVPEPRAEPPPVAAAAAAPAPAPSASESHPEVDAARGEFTTPASMLDTWNAVGQLLVRLEGVGYEGRAQMLGIYAVRYRGEQLLIVTRALVMRSRAQGMSTKVGAAFVDGKPSGSAAAVELLGQLQRRLPAELARIEAGGGPSARQAPGCAARVGHAGRDRPPPRCPAGARDHAPAAAATAPGPTRTPVAHSP